MNFPFVGEFQPIVDRSKCFNNLERSFTLGRDLLVIVELEVSSVKLDFLSFFKLFVV